MRYGCDISEHQTIKDYRPFKSLDFVILREGYRQSIDKRFISHVKGMNSVDAPIHSVYHFIYALTIGDAIKEARSCAINIKKAGLPDDIMVWADLEYDSIDKAKAKGIEIGNKEINSFTVAFCEELKSLGHPVGIYTNIDFYKNHYTQETLSKYPLWLADYTGAADYPCMIQQTTSSGIIEGYAGTLDMDTLFDDVEPSAHKSREAIVRKAESMIGWSEEDGRHRLIIDAYNSFLPHPRGYRVTYYDAWCATFISALAIMLGYTDIIPVECGCPNMIDLARKMGIWVEDESRTPEPADIIFYDWQDSGVGDNLGLADHVGLVESVSGDKITVIEGNYHDAVSRRVISVNGKYIRGYIVPKYDDAPETHPKVDTVPTVSGPTVTIRKGSTGTAVKALQTALCMLGYVLDVDSEYGPLTAKQVMLFQSDNGLEVDGITGRRTWTAVYSKLSEYVRGVNRVPQYVGMVRATELNVRCFPSALFDRITAWPVLGDGNLIDVCATIEMPDESVWHYVRIAGYIYGFVSAQYIRKK